MARAHGSTKFPDRIGMYLLLAVLMASAAAAQSGVVFAQLPLSFQSDGVPGVYTAAGGGYRLSLASGEAVLDFGYGAAPLRLRMVGANPEAQAAALEPVPGRTFYLRGRDPAGWRMNVPSCSFRGAYAAFTADNGAIVSNLAGATWTLKGDNSMSR